MSQTTNTTPADTVLIPATDPEASEGVFFTVEQLRAAMSPIGYMTVADQINAAAAAAAQATANAAIPQSSLGQPLGPIQSDASNKVPLANLPSSVLGSSHYLGTWDASANTPHLASGVAPAVSSPIGGYYIVSVAGTTNLNGHASWHAGDWAIWNGTSWDDLSGQVNPVSSVAGLQGAVSAGQLATALAGSVGLSSSSGVLNVVLGTTANTVAAGNDARIVGSAQVTDTFAFVQNVAAITSYTGNAPSLRTAGYYTAGDGGGAHYTQTNTGAPPITDGLGRKWYLQDVNGTEVNILQFGARADGVTDIQPAWAAADAYAAANGKGVFIPSAPSTGYWHLTTPMVTTARSLRFEAPYAPGTGHGTVIHFFPTQITDLLPAITLTGNGVLAENVSVIGPDVMPTLATLMTSGWVIAASSFQGTITGSGTTMNSVSGLTGTPAVGQQVSGAGMSSLATVTAVSGSTLTISPAQPLIGTAQTFTTCALPSYSAFKAGTVGISVAASARLRNCYTAGAKVGILLNEVSGHCDFYECSAGGFFGYYCLDNSYDFSWFGGGSAGLWAGFAFGTTNLIGANGGLQGNWFRVQMPLQAAYHVYQCKDSNFTGYSYGLVGNFYGCSFESCNEAAIQVLSTSQSGVRLFGCTQQWGVTALPNTITPVPQQSLLSLGNLVTFSTTPNNTSSSNAWEASALGKGAYSQYSLSAALTPRTQSDLDFRFLDSNLNISQPRDRWTSNYRSIDLAQKGDLGVRREMLPSANLLKNPEQNSGGNGLSTAGGNWIVPNSTVTIGAYSSFSELSSILLPQQVQEVVGLNPMVIKVAQNVVSGVQSTGNVATLNAAAATVAGTRIPIWLRFWELQLSNPQQITFRVNAQGGYLYFASQTPTAGSWAEVLGVNQNLSMGGDTTGIISNLTIGLGNAPAVYLVGVMVGLGEIGPYNPLNQPYASNGLAVGDGSLTDAQTAPRIITGTGAPNSTTQPAGTLYLRKDGTSTGIYQYLNGAWVSY